MSAFETRAERVRASLGQKSRSSDVASIALLAFAATMMALGVSGCDSGSDGGTDQECSAEQPCPSGQFCNARHVCENETGGACSEDDPCPTGQFCNAGNVCENETGGDCSEDDPCPTGQICNADNVCENDPDFGADKPRLFVVEAEAEGANCRSGGQALRSGIDLNANGTLEASEIDGEQYNCFPSPFSSDPRFILDLEDVEAGSDCADGGVVLHSGYDIDESEILDDGERESSVLLCHTDACEGSAPLFTRIVALEDDPFGVHDDARTYELRIELTRAADASTLRVDQFDEGLAPDADFDWAIDANDDHTLLIDVHPRDAGRTHIVISDACGVASVPFYAPYGLTETGVLRVYTDDVPVEGEEISVCWESRYLSDCSMNVGTTANPDIVNLPDVQGCHGVTVLPGHIVNDYMLTGISVTCEDAGGLPITQYIGKGIQPDIYEFNSAGSLSFPASGGQANFRIVTEQMESCALVTSSGSIPVPLFAAAAPVWFTESSLVRLVCEDANGTEYEQPGVFSFVRVGPGITGAGVNSPLNEGGYTKLYTTVITEFVENGSCDLTIHYEGNTVQLDDQELIPLSEVESAIQLNEVYSEFPYVTGGEGSLEATCTGDNGYEQSFTIAFF